MNREGIRILLVSKHENECTYLREQLESRGCHCRFAATSDDIMRLEHRHSFDLILSMIWLQDPLLDKLADSKTTAFFAYPVRNGCWWLPLLQRGQRCLGAPALRPNEFGGMLDQFIGMVAQKNAASRNGSVKLVTASTPDGPQVVSIP